jgi:hypothetical protein
MAKKKTKKKAVKGFKGESEGPLKVKGSIENGRLHLSIPINKTPPLSGTKRSRVLAKANWIDVDDCDFDGYAIRLNMMAVVPLEDD